MKRVCIFLLMTAACGDDDFIIDSRDASADAAATDSATTDSATSDASGQDGGSVDGGPRTDAGGVDAGPAGDSGNPDPDAGSSIATIELTFAGCAPDLSGDVIVVENAESIAITSTAGSFGSIQLALQDERGSVALSTQHRIDTGAVVNIITSSTWTNIAMDSAGVLTGDIPDPITGTLDVDVYEQSAGLIDVTFNGATFQNPSDGSICRVNGRLRTSGLTF